MFKVVCLVRQSLFGKAPLYLADDCCLVSDSTRRSLRSADFLTLSSYGDRTFAAAGPRLWNSLPVQLRNPDTVQTTAEWTPFSGSMNTALCDFWYAALYKNTYLLTYLLSTCCGACLLEVMCVFFSRLWAATRQRWTAVQWTWLVSMRHSTESWRGWSTLTTPSAGRVPSPTTSSRWRSSSITTRFVFARQSVAIHWPMPSNIIPN